MLNTYPNVKLLLTILILITPIFLIISSTVGLFSTNLVPNTSVAISTASTDDQLSTTTEPISTEGITAPSPCTTPCSRSQICFNDTCLHTGNLAITVIWSRMGNCDLVVTTPNGNDIASMYQPGPTPYTDYGQMDAISELMGPENIFWEIDTETPWGTYNICMEVFYFADIVSINDNPVVATVFVRKPSRDTEIFTRAFTQRTDGVYHCNTGSSSYIASITYP